MPAPLAAIGAALGGYVPLAVRARWQDAALRALVRHAFDAVPIYRELWQAAGVSPSDIRSRTDLRRLPVVDKATLVAAGLDRRLSRRHRPDRLRYSRTSGSTGMPFDIAETALHVLLRRTSFLRALRCGGYRPGERLALVTTASSRPRVRALGWHYVSSEAPAELQVVALERLRPACVYGLTTPLRRLAEHLAREQSRLIRPRLLFTSAETLDGPTRRLLRDVFGAQIRDIYGLSETGPLAWSCAAGSYHLGNDAVLCELLPTDHPERRRLVVTPLLQYAMPLVRYDTGDLVVPARTDRCACGRTGARVHRIEGRAVDCLRGLDGRLHSPYELTLAVERVEGIARYRIIQPARDRVTVELQPSVDDAAPVAAAVAAGLRRILGADMQIDVVPGEPARPAPGRKFKVVENRVDGNRQCDS